MTRTNWEITRGDDFVMPILVEEDGVAEDITSCVFTLTAKPNKYLADDDEGVVQVSGVIVSGPAGTLTITIPAETTLIMDGSYYYDVEYVKTDSTVKTLLQGIITVISGVTDAPPTP